jgi:nucleotide-binding universal stress UspA family protein
MGHVFVMEVPAYPRLLFITDAALNVEPDLAAKRDIVQNAIDLALAVGVDTPKVAILSAVETVNPKLRSSLEAAALSQAAVTFAAEEAALRGAALLAVCALADSPGNRGGTHVLQEDFEKIMVSCEKEHPDVVVRRQVADGSARAELLRATCDAQMLIVGSRGCGGEPGMMLGSVSYAVLHHARCPVSVVHLR